MNERYPVLNGTGGEVLPIADATLYTASMYKPDQSNSTQFYIEFFSDADGLIPVTPTAGTIAVAGSPLGNNYSPAGNVATITASQCSTPDSTYTPPLFVGRIVKGRISFSGITGALTARAAFWRY